jgi:hypothetical protein
MISNKTENILYVARLSGIYNMDRNAIGVSNHLVFLKNKKFHYKKL